MADYAKAYEGALILSAVVGTGAGLVIHHWVLDPLYCLGCGILAMVAAYTVCGWLIARER